MARNDLLASRDADHFSKEGPCMTKATPAVRRGKNTIPRRSCSLSITSVTVSVAMSAYTPCEAEAAALGPPPVALVCPA